VAVAATAVAAVDTAAAVVDKSLIDSGILSGMAAILKINVKKHNI